MITARCHPALRGLLPEPVPAARALPDWLRDMPGQVEAPSLGGEAVRTLKHCPPIIDAMSMGILIPLVCDLHIQDGHVHWDWDPPVLTDSDMTRAPVGLHVPEQAQGVPFPIAVNAVLKFMNFWTLSAPDGYSILFTHPLNRPDLPFRTLSGVVDCDRFGDGFVHFPALWTDAGFAGTLPAGTPVAQALVVPRAAQGLVVEDMSDPQIARTRDLQRALAEERGVYRRRFRH